ncbi:MAG TPA: helix-hairpin-helix domain-containing protein, partial [Bacteroidetes bacterium]|nr:helix-hairpin-helix domain-containing protein [Bacteroidota bacterium]
MSFFRITILLVLCCLATPVVAQIIPDSVRQNTQDDDGLDQVIEDAVTDIETDDQTDWTIFTDLLEDLKQKPLSLNSASQDELLMLPGMTVILVNNLMSYIQEFGKLTSIYELQAVPGFDVEVVNSIRSYISVKETRGKDISPGTLHASGPSFEEVVRNARHELLLRYVRILEVQKGYTAPPQNNPGASRYRGDRNKYYARYRMRYNRNFSLAFVGEKDQGEEFRWAPRNNFYGFDFTAGHISIRDYGHIKRLVVGDYNIQLGQGLLLSTGLGFGKGSQ